MKQTILQKVMAGILIISSIGCVDNERNLSGDDVRNLPKDQYFDFNMNQTVALDIDYCFKDNNYFILFDIYNQNPFESVFDEKGEESLRKKDIEPIYRAATDKQGKFTGEMNTMSDVSKVWLVSDYLGTVSPIELTISADHKLSFNQDAYIQAVRSQSSARTRGVTGNDHKYLEDWYTLPGGDWNDNGRPNNLSKEMNIPSADILYFIKYVFRKATVKVDGVSKLENILTNYPQFFDEKNPMTSDIPIVKETEVSLVFVNSSAGWYNTVGYYTYKTGTTPTIKDIRKTIVFPNVSPVYKTLGYGALVCGEEVKLKYWNGEKYEDKFPAGYTIGWCLQGMGFKEKDRSGDGKVADIIKGQGTRYSTRHLNTDNKQRTVSLRDAQSGKIVAVGFEDNIDLDYSDATFYIHTSVANAVDPILPAIPEEPEAIPDKDKDKYTITYSGTLAFEDLWPKDGDYDMNDVMIKYTSTIYRMVLDNRIYQIEDKFTLQNCGGYFQNGFGYQYHKLSSSNIKKVEISYPEGCSRSGFIKGGENMESGQAHPTFILFDNTTKFKNINDDKKKEFTVTVALDGINEKDIVPPYNPFIIIETDKGRGKEVHLVNYPPTDKASRSLFGTGKDISRPDEELYYVSTDLMPFAINMPVSLPTPEETVRIDQSYPKFAAWAKSNGVLYKDWYKK